MWWDKQRDKGGDVSSTWLVVGLGNPGDKYRFTRHNVGRDAVSMLAEAEGKKFRRDRSGLMLADLRMATETGEAQVHLAYSTTYMNVTGQPVAAFAHKKEIGADHILVLHDDLDLPPHTLRLKKGGGEGGHNGLRSLSSSLKTRDYLRLRMGVGRPPGRMEAADYVLAVIPPKDREEWEITEGRAADVVVEVIRKGLIAAQRDLHSPT